MDFRVSQCLCTIIHHLRLINNILFNFLKKMGLDEYFSKENFYFIVMWSRDWPFWVKIRVFDKSDLVGRYLRNLKSNFVQIWNFLLFSTSPQKPCLRFLIKFFFLCEIYLQKWRVSIFFEKIFFEHKFAYKTNLKTDIKILRHGFWKNHQENISAKFWSNLSREFFSMDLLLQKSDFSPKTWIVLTTMKMGKSFCHQIVSVNF